MTTPAASLEATPEIERKLGGILVPRRGEHAMVRGEGCWLWDDQGRRYLDLTASYGTAPLGHAHPALVAAITAQAGRLISLSANFYNDRRAELLALLRARLPAHFAHFFLCNSGTEANEAALKFAHLATRRRGWVALKRGFHGRTLGALATTWNPRFRETFAPLLQPATFVDPGDLEGLDRAITDETSVFLAEVIQGESGVWPLEPAFLARAQELCRERGALFLVDEIQTGFGRAGAWFAHAELGLGHGGQGRGGLEPDLMTLAKGMAGGFPIGAVAMSARVAGSLEAGLHGSTFGGGPLQCAAALATLETLAVEDLPGRSRVQGDRLLAALRPALQGARVVREVRGRGLMIGIELRQKVAPYLDRLMREHAVVALPAGPTVLRLLPALVIDDEQIDRAVEAIAAVLTA
ncbi:MAG TPA: aminotransferase class III-fold pyridoxal phosphate-dependent enzyme [Thermoanaerobaculia bacterium]|nr:aminotransferase class III-fold pyridoxal phosphate-dependent enzyme [Thermoanaerobaculia bacterium]